LHILKQLELYFCLLFYLLSFTIFIYYYKPEGAVCIWRFSARPDQTFSRDLTFERNTEVLLQQYQESSVLAMYYVYRSLAQNALHIHSFSQSFRPSFLPSFLRSFIHSEVCLMTGP
jgi:hypothetical protein